MCGLLLGGGLMGGSSTAGSVDDGESLLHPTAPRLSQRVTIATAPMTRKRPMLSFICPLLHTFVFHPARSAGRSLGPGNQPRGLTSWLPLLAPPVPSHEEEGNLGQPISCRTVSWAMYESSHCFLPTGKREAFGVATRPRDIANRLSGTFPARMRGSPMPGPSDPACRLPGCEWSQFLPTR